MHRLDVLFGGADRSHLATLFVLPSFFALLQAKASTKSASMDPDDPGVNTIQLNQSMMNIATQIRVKAGRWLAVNCNDDEPCWLQF